MKSSFVRTSPTVSSAPPLPPSRRKSDELSSLDSSFSISTFPSIGITISSFPADLTVEPEQNLDSQNSPHPTRLPKKLRTNIGKPVPNFSSSISDIDLPFSNSILEPQPSDSSISSSMIGSLPTTTSTSIHDSPPQPSFSSHTQTNSHPTSILSAFNSFSATHQTLAQLASISSPTLPNVAIDPSSTTSTRPS